ncbi:hypothetical protein CARUB_v10021566mg [Capsella rubella]|uniref:Transcription factor TFIIIC triple barrel domain-containing protein n=1 Tax=Capsella rubella TaxID=81985 RepID=R0GE63_9BRAS|nr:hypothetical protein CARUB_v10021566mg [Capsella rubella]
MGDEEYVMIDLDDISRHIDIPSNAPYTLSGLDTFNPVMVIDGKMKLAGEYIETIGTCLAFSDNKAKLHKILKFRLAAALDNEDGETKTSNL